MCIIEMLCNVHKVYYNNCQFPCTVEMAQKINFMID